MIEELLADIWPVLVALPFWLGAVYLAGYYLGNSDADES